MWLMLQHSSPEDFVVATGESRSVREFLAAAGEYAGVDWQAHVATDARYFRPTEVDFLKGDAEKAKRLLGWEPEIGFTELVRSMVENDLELARQEETLVHAGHKVAPRGNAHV
jgi:GDPmannose 4,6-dehydratase